MCTCLYYNIYIYLYYIYILCITFYVETRGAIKLIRKIITFYGSPWMTTAARVLSNYIYKSNIIITQYINCSTRVTAT